MAESTDADSRESNERDELRTLSFRLREIQRLLGMRVTQENRRLEAEGIEPVEEPDQSVGAGHNRGDLAERSGDEGGSAGGE